MCKFYHTLSQKHRYGKPYPRARVRNDILLSMLRTLVSILTLCTVLFTTAADSPCVTNCAGLSLHTKSYTPFHAPFDVTAKVAIPPTPADVPLVIEDASGGYIVHGALPNSAQELRAGDVIRIRGRIDATGTAIFKPVKTLDIIAHVAAPVPPQVPAEEILSGKWDYRHVRTHGILKDILIDDIDPRFIYLVMDSNSRILYLACRNDPQLLRSYDRLIGAVVSAQGVVDILNPLFSARHLGRIITLHDVGNLTIEREISHDLANIPDTSGLDSMQPADVVSAGRRRVTGRVLAVWHGDSFLVRLANGDCANVSLAHGQPPRPGQTVLAAGFPTTDLYHINLTRAIWQPSEATIPEEMPPTNMTAAAISTDADGRICFKPKLHGQSIRISGTVCRAPNATAKSGLLTLEDGDLAFSVDTSACLPAPSDIEIGCRIEVTGICILDIENWTPNTAFPRIKGFSVIVRTPDDIRLIERSPWWTKERLLVALFATLGILFCALALILLLRHLLARREREIKREICARVESDCLVQERTRLAVELHDSITQNLTGATLAMRVAQKESANLNERAGASLDLAIKTVDSSLADLRNCIWDLRNSTLEEADFAEAIRLTIQPHVDDIDLALRFNVPRERLSDNAAHAILSIIRELVINATRHGKATSVRIAGAIESGKLLFSVADNGCGFDVDGRPGVRQGHFGLRGVSERVKAFQGDIDIHSAIGKGTKITISIALPNGGRS